MITALLCLLTVVLAVALAIGGLALSGGLVPLETREAHNGATGTIYAALYVVYGVALGFSLVLVWQQFDAAGQTAEREAGALERVYRLAERFPEPSRGRVQDLAVDYARAVVRDEWASMRRGEASARADRLADELGRAVRATQPANEAQSAVYAEALTRLDDLRESRALRILDVREGLPLILWFVLVVGAVLTVGFTYLFGMRSFLLHALAVGSLAAILALVLFTIGVLDHPFDGDVRVEPEAFEDLLEEIGGR